MLFEMTVTHLMKMASSDDPRRQKKIVSRKVLRTAHHTWTNVEDVALVRCLHTLTDDLKWKGDNMLFRPGYLVQLEKMLEKELSESNVKAEPHIESRIRLLKRQYNAIVEMIANRTCFRWNDLKKCVTASKDVYDEWV